ncbi:hypothetical protein FJ364_03605 [Candidatus Dependentiae bacterium]|nr:hypothetical protein [Candidatus Dependentiae bacterium]
MKKMYTLVLLVIAAFALRALVFWGYLQHENRFWQVDTTTYDTLAQELVVNNRYATPDGTLNAYRLPGYPFFLATIYKATNNNRIAALWIQIFLASFIPLLVFLLAQVLFPNRHQLAWAAALLTTCHLGYVLYAGFMMTETLFVFLFLSFLIFFCRAVLLANRRNIKYENDIVCSGGRFYDLLALNPAAKGQAFIQFYDEMMEPDVAYACCTRSPEDGLGLDLFFAGLFLGVASLIRPVGHYLIIVAVFILFFSGNNRLKQAGECLVLAFGWLIVVGGWLLRNWMLFGHLFFHTLPGGHFLYLSAARVIAHDQNISYQAARDQLRSIIQERESRSIALTGRILNQYEVCVLHEKLAVETFLHSPITSLTYWIQDMARATLSLYSAELLYLESGRKQIAYFATGRPIKDWFMRYIKPQTEKNWLKLLIWGEALFHFFLLLGTFLFCVRALLYRTRRLTHVFWLTIPFISLFIVIALSGGYARMRLPMEFLMIILACFSFFQAHSCRENVE